MSTCVFGIHCVLFMCLHACVCVCTYGVLVVYGVCGLYYVRVWCTFCVCLHGVHYVLFSVYLYGSPAEVFSWKSQLL